MRVLAFRHAPLEGIGSIADTLAAHEISCHMTDLYAEPDARFTLDDAAGLILMGGPMSVNDELPWLRREIAAIQDAVACGIPVLGICLGAQLIAKALGARVYRSPDKEIGWSPVCFTEAARSDALFEGCAADETVFQWHGETFDLPPGAELLGHSAVCRHQAFRHGAQVYGIQFHLEVTPGIIADWLRADAACGALREVTVPVDPRAHAARTADLAARVFGRWCGLLR